MADNLTVSGTPVQWRRPESILALWAQVMRHFMTHFRWIERCLLQRSQLALTLSMSKKYKGKPCVYCAQKDSDAGDHVFAREFFLLEDRHNLPKVPCCRACNKAKSDLEHYVLSVLPLGGAHPQATSNILANLPRRLVKNERLHREISKTAQQAWLRNASGIYAPTLSVHFDGAKLEELLKYVARGLTWHHWGKYIGSDFYFRVLFPPEMLSNYLQSQMHTLASESVVRNDLGRGTIQYEGAQAGEAPDLMFWAIALYGGVMLANSGGDIETTTLLNC